MRVKFWGTRGSVPTPGRATEKFGGNTACVEISQDGHRLILDAGTGIRELGLAMTAEGASSPAMLFSHLHWDHIQGLPFFIPLFQPLYQITIFAPESLKERLEKVLYKQMATDVFPVDFAALAADIRFESMGETGIDRGPFHITAFEQNHPGGSYAYRVEAGGRTVIYATDNEADPNVEPDERTVQAAPYRGANLLIADAQYTYAEYPDRVGWGHGVMEHVTRIAQEAAVDRLAITHHDPMRDDEQLTELERFTRRMTPGLDLFFARDGLAVKV